VGILAGVPPRASAQVELDRTIERVYGTPIMTSDVRQARLLKLVTDVTSDDTVLRALENRLLILVEAGRGQRVDPDREAIVARRLAWTKAWAAGTDLPALMARAGMTDQALDAWFRDELRIVAFLDQRFGQTIDRDARMATWLLELRRRANLIGKRGPIA